MAREIRTREQTIKGLKCCSGKTNMCKTCPYRDYAGENCMGQLMRDALALIQLKEGKV